jgi:hypothetical protein
MTSAVKGAKFRVAVLETAAHLHRVDTSVNNFVKTTRDRAEFNIIQIIDTF